MSADDGIVRTSSAPAGTSSAGGDSSPKSADDPDDDEDDTDTDDAVTENLRRIYAESGTGLPDAHVWNAVEQAREDAEKAKKLRKTGRAVERTTTNRDWSDEDYLPTPGEPGYLT